MIYLNDIAGALRYFPEQSGDIVDLQSVQIKPEGEPDSAYVQVIADYAGIEGTDHYWEFPGAEEIIRAFLVSRNITVATLGITHRATAPNGTGGTTDTSTITVLFTAVRLLSPYVSADQLCRQRFLHQNSFAWLMPGQNFSLFYYSEPQQVGIGLPLMVERRFRDGSSEDFSIQTERGLAQIEFSYRPDVALDTLTFASRQFRFYYIDAPVVEIFAFRNVFNILDTVSVPAAITEEPETDFDTAQRDRILFRYDVEHNKIFSLTTARMSPLMYDKLLELCQAGKVSHRTILTDNMEQYRDIIITEYRLTKSTEPDTGVSLEMKFRYADTTLDTAANLY